MKYLLSLMCCMLFVSSTFATDLIVYEYTDHRGLKHVVLHDKKKFPLDYTKITPEMIKDLCDDSNKFKDKSPSPSLNGNGERSNGDNYLLMAIAIGEWYESMIKYLPESNCEYKAMLWFNALPKKFPPYR